MEQQEQKDMEWEVLNAEKHVLGRFPNKLLAQVFQESCASIGIFGATTRQISYLNLDPDEVGKNPPSSAEEELKVFDAMPRESVYRKNRILVRDFATRLTAVSFVVEQLEKEPAALFVLPRAKTLRAIDVFGGVFPVEAAVSLYTALGAPPPFYSVRATVDEIGKTIVKSAIAGQSIVEMKSGKPD